MPEKQRSPPPLPKDPEQRAMLERLWAKERELKKQIEELAKKKQQSK